VTIADTLNQTIRMVAFASLRASLVLVGLLAPVVLAAPASTKTVLTPFGERPIDDVYAVPEGNVPSGMRAKNTKLKVSQAARLFMLATRSMS
jgi:hypothetical protein